MQYSSYFQLCLVASGLALSTYACGDSAGDDDGTSEDGGGASSSSGQSSSSSSSGGSSSGSTSSSSSSGGSSSGSTSSSSSSGSTSGSSSGNLDDGGSDGESDASTDGGADAEPDAGPEPEPAVQFLGRWGDLDDDPNDDGPTTSWPGAKVVLRFHGTGVSAVIGQTAPWEGKSRYDILVDGVVQPAVLPAETAPLIIDTGSKSYTLATGLTDQDHTLVLVRRTEPQQGINNFKSFAFEGAGYLKAPPPRPTRRIEVLTESTVNGFGVDSPLKLAVPTGFNGSRQCNVQGTWTYHNARKSMPYKLATRFDAELFLLGMSGIGITGNNGHDANWKFANLYPRTNPIAGNGATNLWNSADAPADVVMVMLGGADFENPGALTTAAQFVPELDALVGAVRTRNPNAHIFMVIGPQLKDGLRTILNDAMTTVRTNRAADLKLAVKLMAQNNQPDTYEVACFYHANEALHDLMAAQAETWIEEATGWVAP